MDKTKRSITCDACEKELIVDSHYPHSYGLKLKVEDYGYNTSNFVYDMAVGPSLDRAYHFCGEKCLKEWVAKR